MAKTGTFDFYHAGKFNGPGPDLWMFNFYKPDGSYAVATEEEAADMRRSAIGLGYEPRPNRCGKSAPRAEVQT